jgi:hypothetical protein
MNIQIPHNQLIHPNYFNMPKRPPFPTTLLIARKVEIVWSEGDSEIKGTFSWGFKSFLITQNNIYKNWLIQRCLGQTFMRASTWFSQAFEKTQRSSAVRTCRLKFKLVMPTHSKYFMGRMCIGQKSEDASVHPKLVQNRSSRLSLSVSSTVLTLLMARTFSAQLGSLRTKEMSGLKEFPWIPSFQSSRRSITVSLRLTRSIW